LPERSWPLPACAGNLRGWPLSLLTVATPTSLTESRQHEDLEERGEYGADEYVDSRPRPRDGICGFGAEHVGPEFRDGRRRKILHHRLGKRQIQGKVLRARLRQQSLGPCGHRCPREGGRA